MHCSWIKIFIIVFLLLMGSMLFISCLSKNALPAFPPTLHSTIIPPTETIELTTPTETVMPLGSPPSPISPFLTPTMTDIKPKYLVFKTEDGKKIVGKLFGDGDIAVILAHQGTTGADQKDWEPFARLMAGRGFAVMTFDFRGRGASEGYPDTYLSILDMRASIDKLHQLGFQKIACIGASMGGTTCLRAAVDGEFIGVGIIASPLDIGEPTNTEPEELAILTIPKLFICAEKDRFEGLTAMLHNMYNIAPEPKRLRLFPGEAHGTELFGGPYADQFAAELVYFLENLH